MGVDEPAKPRKITGNDYIFDYKGVERFRFIFLFRNQVELHSDSNLSEWLKFVIQMVIAVGRMIK